MLVARGDAFWGEVQDRAERLMGLTPELYARLAAADPAWTPPYTAYEGFPLKVVVLAREGDPWLARLGPARARAVPVDEALADQPV